MKHTNKMREHSYRGIGMCIYCMTPLPDSKLTKEHIIPFALNGTLVFQNSVCEPCRDYTNKAFENDSLQADFLVPRLLLELRRRNKKTNKPLPAVDLIDANNQAIERVTLELSDYPPVVSFFDFEPAGKLIGVDRKEGLGNFKLQLVKFPFPKFPAKNKIVEINHKTQWSCYALALAKMAYSFAVAEGGVKYFDGQGIRDLLLGKRQDIMNFVGGPLNREYISSNQLHFLNVNTLGGKVSVSISLFASYSAIRSEVYLGDLANL